ncbi:MAG: GDP-mannose 4,6-dehydratase [Sphingomonadales bacterium]
MKTRTALILGAAGQDGSYLAEMLLAKGYRVVGTTREMRRVPDHSASRAWQAVELVELDLCDAQAVALLVRQTAPDEIYNFAAFSTGSGMYDQPVSMGDVNGLAVARILDAIQGNAAARFCQASSSEMFGAPRSSPQNEATEFSPRSPYGAAKLFGHHMIDIARQRHGTFACSAILFNHESPRRSQNFVTRKITRAAAAISLGIAEDLVLGDLDARRDWGHSRDVVHAMWLMLQADRADDYVIATGQTHSVAELCEIAFSHVGLDWTAHVHVDANLRRVSESIQLVGDATRARDLLGWAPSVSFREIIEEMVDADLHDMQALANNKGCIA